jgi:Cys-rich repeat protein
MQTRNSLIAGVAAVVCASALALAQTPTPTAGVNSNVSVNSFAQSRGTPCTSRGTLGCGGCYPAAIPACDPTSELPKVNPEWQPVGPMIDLGGGVPADASLPPASAPVLISGSVELSKINTGGDFPGSHIGDDQNTFILLDDTNRLATGNQSSSYECPGENCNRIEMELEFNKYPLYAWAGEGDRILAAGRWIFDCGHPDPDKGHCSTGSSKTCSQNSDCSEGTDEVCVLGHCTRQCISDSDCDPAGTCSGGSNSGQPCHVACDCPGGTCNGPATCVEGVGTCSVHTTTRCIIDSECPLGETCNNVNFNARTELHPPQAVVVLRQNKFITAHGGAIPATRADVYLSNDGGGAGDACTVTHLDTASSVLTAKSCFSNMCSDGSRACRSNKDCKASTCNIFDPTISQPLADVNAPDFNHCSVTARHCLVNSDCPSGETCILMNNFEFDMPLPPQPTGATLKTQIKYPKKPANVAAGVRAPKPTLVPTLAPTPNLHVIIPMASRLAPGKCSVTTSQRCKVDSDCPSGQVCKGGKFPGYFTGSISAGWNGDTSPLKHVIVKFKKLVINNPLKDRVQPITKQCVQPGSFAHSGLSNVACQTDQECLSGTCSGSSKTCHSDFDCPKGQHCSGTSARCLGGVIPGWNLMAQVNGDWTQFNKLDTIGAAAPFLAPPYVVPPTPAALKVSGTFNEWVPADSSIHIETTGLSVSCTDILYGMNLKDNLARFGVPAGAACLGASDRDPGAVDITLPGPSFLPPSPTPGTTPSVVCTPGAGTKPSTCFATSGEGSGGKCSNAPNQLCVADDDCPGTCSTGGPCMTAGDCKHCSVTTSTSCASDTDCPAGTCSGGPLRCRHNGDCPSGQTCNTPIETCVPDSGATCGGQGQCMGTCLKNPSTPCHGDDNCVTTGDTCFFGGAFTLQYTIQVKK